MMRDRLWPAVFRNWALAVAVLGAVSAVAIAGLRFPDPDDAMRLMEVRDWLAGQSWWDVAQHRLNGGDFAMHWSRLVDLPLALVLGIADLLVAPMVADRIALTLVPLVTLLAVMAGIATLTDRVAGREQARLALLLTPLSIPLIYQLRPMRIDHHGWQIALAIGAVVALVGAPTARRGALAGLALAALITISLEGLPIVAIIGGVLALAWVIDVRHRDALGALVRTLFLAALALHVATRGPGLWAPACDAISPAWLTGLGVAALGLGVAAWRSPDTRLARLFAVVASGGAAGATLLILTPACLQGPFATLDPLVRTLWYEQVSEGLPLWRQPLVWAVITVAVPMTGLVGTIRALRVSEGEARRRRAILLAVLVPVVALSCLVNRCGATANALALPGAASLLLAMLTRARAIPNVARRILATAAALVVASPGVVAAGALAQVDTRQPGATGGAGTQRAPCERFDQVRALAELPPGVVFLPVDVTPDLLATTRHRGVAAGYHRNAASIHRVLAAFTGTPAAAERIVRASGAVYVAGCPGLNETLLYDAVAPHGLWARLEGGERFAWLTPVPISGSPVLAWRVVPAAPSATTARPGSAAAPEAADPSRPAADRPHGASE